MGCFVETHLMRLYSYLNASTGFCEAALYDCRLTVNSATAIATVPATANIHHGSVAL